MQPVIYADLRCLQQDEYRIRGIGHHVAALLRTREQSACSTWKMIGLTDPQSPQLPSALAALVDEVTCSVNPCNHRAPAVFIDGTPMTHDTRFSLRFLNDPAFFRTAVLHDFIPLDWPGYLPTVADRIDYVAKLARLRKFDYFFPVSEYTAWRASELFGLSRNRMTVTGSCVRDSLYDIRRHLERLPFPGYTTACYFVIVIAADARKNPEVAIKAVRHLNLLYGRRIPLKVVGHYTDYHKHRYLEIAAHPEGEGFLEFCRGIPDEELVSVYAGALATIVPSHIEGFSLPVVEASVCGCPVIASTCAAHLELIDQAEALFPSDDAAALCERLDAVLNSPPLRDSLVASQAHLATKFHEGAVGERFWSALERRFENRPRPALILERKKPRLAFLSPYPPDCSDAASYTAMTMRFGRDLFDSDLYTDAPRPFTSDGSFRDGGRISLSPLLTGRYDAIVFVAENSPRYGRAFEVFERYGGPCILQEGALTQIYLHQLGRDKFLEFAAKRIGGSVSKQEVCVWFEHCTPPSAKFIIERASPLIVHTATQQRLIRDDFRVGAQLITSCPTIFFHDQELTTSARNAVRERHGIAPGTFLVSTFGDVSRAKGMETCVLALELLRSWNIPAELYFIGDSEVEQGYLARLSSLYDVVGHVHFGSTLVGNAVYRDFLMASDAAVQLRSYAFGELSTPLANCVSAGLPSVTTADMATSCEAPAYVSTVPNRFSPLQVAEHLAEIWEAQTVPDSYADARAVYLEAHNFDNYAKRLIEILGLV